MLRRFLRYAALSTALFYPACIPPEEDLESQCEGEVLFEEEFDGGETVKKYGQYFNTL